jgi:hypothetical protein
MHQNPKERKMFKNFMILASVAGALAVSVASPTAQAQGLNDDRSYEQYCRDLNADTGFSDAMRYAQQAEKEFQQASQYDELAANAAGYAKTAGNPADQADWNARAQEHRDQAKRLRDSANRNLDRSKEARAKFRDNCDLSEESFVMLDGFVGTLIQSAEIAADPEKKFAEEEKFERPKQKTTEKSSIGNRKSAEKSSKIKRKVANKKSKIKKQPRWDEEVDDEAVAALAQFAVGMAVEGVSHKRHRDYMSDGYGQEEMGKMKKMKGMKKVKKMKKLKRLPNFNGGDMVLSVGSFGF